MPKSNLYAKRMIIPSRNTTMSKRRQASPLPIRHSNNPKLVRGTRSRNNLNSPHTHSDQKSSNEFNKNRGVSPTLATSRKKIINNSNLLKYEENEDRQNWIREINQALFSKQRPNDLENFFFLGMSMKDCINKELCKALGKIFYNSIFCLPIFLFRSSCTSSRIFLNDINPEGKILKFKKIPKKRKKKLNMKVNY